MKCFLLLLFIGTYSLMFAQAPDGFPSTFSASGMVIGTLMYVECLVCGTDPDRPDGDDYVIIENNDVTVTANAGFGHLEFSASGTYEPILTINSGISLVGYTDVEDGAITFDGEWREITPERKH